MKKNSNGVMIASSPKSKASGKVSTEDSVSTQPSGTKTSKRKSTKVATDTPATSTKPKKRGKAVAAPNLNDATRPLDLPVGIIVHNDHDNTDPLEQIGSTPDVTVVTVHSDGVALVRPDIVPDSTMPLQGSNNVFSALDEASGDSNVISPRLLSCQGVECAYASDVGQIRSNNEDNLSAFMALVPGYAGSPELLFGFFVVADGMGGYERGEVASQLAVRTATSRAIEKIYLRAIAGQGLGDGGETPSEIMERIIADANAVVAQQATRERNTMGTTIVCALIVGNVIYTGHVGDSRLYGLRRENGELEQLTTDHSVVQRLVDTGTLTPEEAAMSPQRSLLYRSLGQPNIPPADTSFLHARDYTYLMLCSDGLWDMVSDTGIAQILRGSENAEEACRLLITTANQNGGEDNVSAIVVKLAG